MKLKKKINYLIFLENLLLLNINLNKKTIYIFIFKKIIISYNTILV